MVPDSSTRRRLSSAARTVRCPSDGKPVREYIQASDSEMIVVWCSHEFELFVALWPLVMQSAAVAACRELLRWLRREEKSLFLLACKY
jgi:hypothetical protein